jgi:NADH dehydrogenase [ubiquinone] 1 alpha subcomplex assembly factor 1
VHFDYDTRPEVNISLGKPGSAMFWGDMRLQLKPGMEGKVRGGWAGFRNKVPPEFYAQLPTLLMVEQPRPTIFGNMTEDASGHDYIALRLRVAGEPKTHSSYYVNIQTSGPISTDLWQHRIFFRKGDGRWEEIYASVISNLFLQT